VRAGEEGEFRAGTGAAELGIAFLRVDEGATWALVRVADGKTMLAARAEGIGPVLTQNGIFIISKKRTALVTHAPRRGFRSRDGIRLRRRTEVSALSAVGGDLFV
jgi:hypothetical protein